VFFDKRVPNNHDRSQRFSLLLDDGSKSQGTHEPMPGLELTQNSLSGIPTSLTTPRNTFQQDQDTNTQDDMSSHSSAEELSKENDNLKDEIIKLMALDDSDFGEAPRSGDRKKRGNEKVRRACSKIIKKRLWPNTKFVTSERQLTNLANKVWNELPKDLWGYTEQDKEPFMRMYRDFMGTVINGQRTIVTGDLKKKAFTWMDNHFDTDKETNKKTAVLPTLEQITRCSVRDIDDGLHEIFDWYIDSLLPSVVGNQYDFCKSKRFFTNCSAVTLPKSPKKLITPSTEAFLVVCWANYRKKWMNHWLFRQDNPTGNLPNPRHKNGVFPNPEVDNLYATEWTNTDNGSTVLGGWHHDGKVAYKTALDNIKTARLQTAKCGVQEALSRQRLRIKYEVTATTEEEFNSKKRKSEPTACKVVEIDFGEESE
jgi:hypothetical protein